MAGVREMKRILMVIFLVALLPLITSCITNSAEPKPILIGVVGPHSGELSAYGIPTLRAVEIAARKVNTDGGVLGRPVEILSIDSRCDTALAEAIAEDLISRGVTAVIGPTCSGTASRSLDIYRDAGVLVISPSAVTPSLTLNNVNPNFFRTIPPDGSEIEALNDFAQEYVAGGNVAILHDDSFFGRERARMLEQLFRTPGRADQVYVQELTNGFNIRVLDELSASKPGAIIYFQSSGSFEIPDTLRMADLIAPVFLHVFPYPPMEEIPVILGEGMFILNRIDNLHNDSSAEVFADYRETYSQDPGFFYLNAYAAMEVLLQAIAEAETTSYLELASILKYQTFNTCLGPIGFDQDGEMTGERYIMQTLQNGIVVSVEDWNF
jgi:branched-chain amino acid transport system substrate-binding protein